MIFRMPGLGLVIALLVLSACAAGPSVAPVPKASSAPEPAELWVFAAASLTDAFAEIGEGFEAQHAGVAVSTNYAGSQNLRTQLEQGAVADVFASANRQQMDAAIASGLVAPDAARVFATNRLVVILPSANPGKVQSLEDLARAGLKLVLAAEEAPAGTYARQSIEKLNSLYGESYKDAVLANVVSNEENVKQVLAKVQLGEADAGIVYTSDAIAAPDLKMIAISPDANVVAEYPIAALDAAPSSALAQEFVEFVLSPEGQSILQKWGFTPIASLN